MKRILIVFMALLMFAIIGCRASPESWEQMNAIEAPFEMEPCFDWACILGGEKVWVTRSYQLNETEWLYYAPKSVKIGNNIYLNDEEFYFIRAGTEGHYTYEKADTEMLKEIFKE